METTKKKYRVEVTAVYRVTETHEFEADGEDAAYAEIDELGMWEIDAIVDPNGNLPDAGDAWVDLATFVRVEADGTKTNIGQPSFEDTP